MLNKKALILGSTSSLGNALSRVFKGKDIKLILHRRSNLKESLIDENTEYLIGDITESGFINKFEKKIRECKPNVYINCCTSYSSQKFEDLNDELIRNFIDLNLIIPTLLLKRIYTHFLNHDGGTIINISSIASLYDGPNESLYSTTKSALHKLHKCIRLESIGKSVNIVNISPGAFKSRITEKRDNYNSLPDPQEIAELITKIILLDEFNINELEIRRK